MEPYLFHGIKWYNYDLLLKILESGYILPRCMQKEEVTDKNNIFSGTKYISLCQNSLNTGSELYKSAYDDFIYGRPMFVLDNKKIDYIYPNLMTLFESDMMSPDEWHSIIFSDSLPRYTYYCDEVQTDKEISLKDSLLAVGLPLSHLKMNYSPEEVKTLLNKTKAILLEMEKDIPVINSSEYHCAQDEEMIKKYTIR